MNYTIKVNTKKKNLFFLNIFRINMPLAYQIYLCKFSLKRKKIIEFLLLN